MNTFRLLVFCLAVSTIATAQPLVLSLVPSARSSTGREATIDLVVLNRSDAAQTFSAPTALLGELTQAGKSWRVELRVTAEPAANSSAIPSGGFAMWTYTFVPPPEPVGSGILELRIAGFPAVRGVLDLSSPAVAGSPPAEPSRPATGHVAKPTTNLVRAEPAASIIQRTFADRLAPHEPVYFIYGSKGPAAKFQLSFKYRILRFTEIASDRMARTLQFAFTQRSLWDIDGESSPFYDTSYMPELIYESLTPKPEEKDTWFTWLGYQAGFRHESNGRDGPVSRSLNVVYVRPVFAFGNLDGWHLLVVPEFFEYIDTLQDNRDLKDYRGYGRLALVLGRNDGPSLMATMWAGKDFHRGTVQLDLTYPIRTKLLDFETYLLVQYFNGYGESLLSYREQSETVRAGFSLVR